MGILKYTQYLYLIIAVAFIYDGITKLNDPTGNPWLSFLIAAVSVFMFFFRRKYAKRFDDHYKKQ
ncbi:MULTISPECIES: hypothetical protein [Flavobacterium]|uniref:Uncharacterized protein n=1 Tax=Flavobacterium pectinovorum TaxID=29533 RepID=A0AB36P2R7_9FLAO|nr:MULTISPECIES: hypothetical protein [Flavobacterium]KIQ17897.1 hypothetical protein RT99_17680 [Flavobacterium sp. MEB061]OXB05800.1 hypothetical protein B0A72_07245 [Flavobacterium pectinovorum]SHM11768.1 hypothetical protein SAMN05444387_1962 [Flavobacterium pectinovorum]